MWKNPSGNHPSDEFIKETIEFWYERTGVIMTEDEARAAIHDITGFIKVLADWDRKDREKQGQE